MRKLLPIALLAMACGGGGNAPTAPPPPPAPAPTTTTTTTTTTLAPAPPPTTQPPPPNPNPGPSTGTCSGVTPPNRCDVGSGPPPPTARCNDGMWSCSQNRSGTCSTHGGVRCWVCPGPLC